MKTIPISQAIQERIDASKAFAESRRLQALDETYKARILAAGLDSLESDAHDKAIGGIIGVCTYIAGAADIPLDAFDDVQARAHYVYRLLSEIRADLARNGAK
jgi:hypothetical protein